MNRPLNTLNLKIEGSVLERLIQRLFSELSRKHIIFRPKFYLTDTWGSPNKVPAIGIPFNYADPVLSEIEDELNGNVEDEHELMMTLRHETGHAMYERGLPVEWRRQPVGQARGMALHESQSLIIEMQAGRSRAFCRFLSPLLNETYPGNEAAFDPDNLARFYTRVEPGFIRVSADEVTYPAHVILRYRLEQALIGGDLTLADLPGA